MVKKKYTFIDLFAGAGGLSEGFVRAGFTPIAHVEMDKYACDTLRTRAAYHYLRGKNELDVYKKYLLEKREGENGEKLHWCWVETYMEKFLSYDFVDKLWGTNKAKGLRNASEERLSN